VPQARGEVVGGGAFTRRIILQTSEDSPALWRPRFPRSRRTAGSTRPSAPKSTCRLGSDRRRDSADLAGTFYRCGPDPQFPPKLGTDIYLNGDGVVTMFRFADGHVDMKSRYVRTEKFEAERSARRALSARIAIRLPTIRASPARAAAPRTRTSFGTAVSSSP